MDNVGTRRAFELLKKLPRVALNNLKPNDFYKPKKAKYRSMEKTKGCGQKGSGQRQNYMPIGYETGNTPFHLRFKSNHYYKDHKVRLSYKPIHLQRLQLLLDTNRLRSDVPVDVTQFCNTGTLTVNAYDREGGILLEDDGLECFKAEINLEVQWATEPIIAAIERMGSTITTAYYDPFSLEAAVNPIEFFAKGKPIPRRMLPPQHLIEYYTDPKNRGYLADPDAIAEERFILSQKYGYILPDLNKSAKKDLLLQRKDPRQIFYGLQPGWIVNFADKNILKPKDPELKEYYSS